MNMRVFAMVLLCMMAQEAFVVAQPLTVEECRARAMEHNRTLSAAKVKLEQSRFDAKSYKANYFPKISLMAMDVYSLAEGALVLDGGKLPIYSLAADGTFVPDVTMNADGTYRLNQYADFPDQEIEWKMKNLFIGNVSVEEPLYTGGKITAAYKMAKLGVDMAGENVRMTESEVLVKTDEAFYQAVRAKELADVAYSYRDMLKELERNVEAALRQGMSTRNDLLKVQVKLNEAELSIQRAENGHKLAIMNLCHVIGMPLDSEVEVEMPESMEVADGQDVGEEVLGASIASRPEYAIVGSKTEMARQNVKIAKSERLPDVAVMASYTYLDGGELQGRKLANNGAAAVGVAVKLPIDLFGGASNKVRSARAAHQIAMLEQQEMNERMELELLQCQNVYEEAKSELQLRKKALEQAAENVRLSKQQYEVGFETLSDYMAVQSMWEQCNANLVHARCQLLLAYTQLQKARGELR